MANIHGVGPTVGRMLEMAKPFSAANSAELLRELKAIKGVGPKTAVAICDAVNQVSLLKK